MPSRDHRPVRDRRGAALIVALVALLVLAALAAATLATVTTGHLVLATDLLALEAKYVALAGLEYAWNGACGNPDARPIGVRFGNGTFYLEHAGGRLRSIGRVEEAERIYSIAAPRRAVVVTGTSAGTIEVWTIDLVRGAPACLRQVNTLVASGPVNAVALADLDRDGDLDIVAGTAAGAVEVWVNRGNCAFVRPSPPVEAAGPVTALAPAGFIDSPTPGVVVGTSAPHEGLSLFLGALTGPLVDGRPSPKLTPHAQGPVDAGAAVTGLDAAVLDRGITVDVPAVTDDGRLRGFLNDGVGRLAEGFTHPPRVHGHWRLRALRAADLDGDGANDAAIASSRAAWHAFANAGDRFRRFPHGRYDTQGDTRGIAVGNADESVDARADVVLVTAARAPERGVGGGGAPGGGDPEEDHPGGGGADGEDDGEDGDGGGHDDDGGHGDDDGGAGHAPAATFDVWLNRAEAPGRPPRFVRAAGAPYPLASDGLAVAFFDVDGDGHADGIAGAAGGGVYLFRGDGRGGFTLCGGAPALGAGDETAVAAGILY
ncbi:MAG: hypothetical protein HZA54_20685 [Planctomycetes bacterium]|nr:hypothetical protein [Planctomycetota bacterium]